MPSRRPQLHTQETGPVAAPITLHESHGIPALAIESIAILLGELNSEAKCSVIIATPSEALTPVSDINENLRVFRAFDRVDRKTFNVLGILKNMPDTWVNHMSDPVLGGNARASAWVQKDPGVAGEFITACAGSLLEYSLKHKRPIRTIISEKRKSDDEKSLHSVEARLGVLVAALFLVDEDASAPFIKDILFDKAEDIGVPRSVAYRHTQKLKDIGVFRKIPKKTNRGKTKLEFSTKPNGDSCYQEVLDLIRIAGLFAVGSEEAIRDGLSSANEIIKNANALPILIQRSFAKKPN